MENIIQQYLLNQLTAQEKADFQAEMQEDEGLRITVHAARALMLSRKLGHELPSYEERQALDKNSSEYQEAKNQLLAVVGLVTVKDIDAENATIKDTNDSTQSEKEAKKEPRPLWQNTKVWFAAASILLLVGLGIWWFSPQKPQIKAEWIANPQPKELPKERQVADETACLNTYNQSINLLHKGQYQQAKEKLLAYKAFCDGDIDYRFLLGLSYFHLPDSTKEAANIWKNMDNGLADDRQTAKIKWHLALVSYKMDDKINCQKYLMELKDLPDSLTHIYPISELNQQLSK